MTTWRLGNGRLLRLDRPAVMAIINLTPDSFYEGSRAESAVEAVQAAMQAAAAGAAMIDLGAESTRPGAANVLGSAQLSRLVPTIRGIRAIAGDAGRIPISIDTTDAEVAEATLGAGADAINDVSAGRDDPSMFEVIARHGAGAILMHRLTRPAQDRYSDQYDTPPMQGDVVKDVREFLAHRAAAAQAAGIPREAIAVDPGLGFGKTVEQNLELIRRTSDIADLGFPVVSGVSRKSFVGRVGLGRDSRPSERLAASLALSIVHLLRGASLFRVHDVREHVEALAAAGAVSG